MTKALSVEAFGVPFLPLDFHVTEFMEAKLSLCEADKPRSVLDCSLLGAAALHQVSSDQHQHIDAEQGRDQKRLLSVSEGVASLAAIPTLIFLSQHQCQATLNLFRQMQC